MRDIYKSWQVKLNTSLILLAMMVGAIFCCSPVCSDQVEHGNVSFDVAPDGRTITFTSASGGLYSFDLSSKHVRSLTADNVHASDPRFSPDGKHIAFVAESNDSDESSVWITSSDGRNARKLSGEPATTVSSLRFSNDGHLLAYAKAYRLRPYSMGGMTWGDYDICILNIDTNKETRLTKKAYYSAGVSFIKQDSREVVFQAIQRGTGLRNHVYAVDIGPPHSIRRIIQEPENKEGGGWLSDLSLSPSGRNTVFISDRTEPFRYDICLGDKDGKLLKELRCTELSAYNQDPVFAPDEQAIYYLAGTEKNFGQRPIFSLYRVDLNGNRTRIADSKLFTDPDSWKP